MAPLQNSMVLICKTLVLYESDLCFQPDFIQMTNGVCVGVLFCFPLAWFSGSKRLTLHMKMGNFFQIISLLLNCIFFFPLKAVKK